MLDRHSIYVRTSKQRCQTDIQFAYGHPNCVHPIKGVGQTSNLRTDIQTVYTHSNTQTDKKVQESLGQTLYRTVSDGHPICVLTIKLTDTRTDKKTEMWIYFKALWAARRSQLLPSKWSYNLVWHSAFIFHKWFKKVEQDQHTHSAFIFHKWNIKAGLWANFTFYLGKGL